MGNRKQLSSYFGYALVFALLSFSVTVPFSNCSQNPQSSDIPSTAFMGESERMQNFQQEFTGKISSSFCLSQDAISCSLKSYSPEVPYQSANLGKKCAQVSEGLEICPSLRGFYFNSLSAQENCEDCRESFEYSEYTCHLNIPNSENVYPIYFTDPRHQTAVQKTYEFCQALTKE